MAALIRRIGPLTAAITLAVLSTVCGSGATDGAVLDVDGAWARATPPGVTTGAAYVTLTSDRDDTLLGASVDPAVAAAVELHTTTTNDSGQSGMTALGAVPLPAGDDVVFEPGGAHAMIVGLAAPLVAGTSFELTLELAEGARRVIDVEVRHRPP